MIDPSDRLRIALADRYPLERELGSGAMATVYLAQDAKLGRKVAVKVMRPELAASLGPDRFLREIEIAAKLTHPHILPVFESGEAGGFLYYVMPYVEGKTLRERLQRDRTVPLSEAVRITQQIASALSYAHERGVIHRDIKPENILLAGDQAIVADFGIARAVQLAGGERLTSTGLAVGTPAYMSPEQAFDPGRVDATSDVYALGCVIYEMLSGHPPFESDTPQALLARHAVHDVPSLTSAGADVPIPVDRVVCRTLAKQPADRYATAGELSEALTDAISSAASVAEERRARRQRWTRALAAAVGVVALSLAGWWLATTRSPPSIEHLAVLPASNMTGDTAQNYFVDGVHEALVTELQRAGLSIIARQSVLQYRHTEKPIREIADELGVDALIQPAVSREGDSVLIDVSLYDGRSQLPLWTQSFPAEVRGVLGIYREITRRIATEIGAVLSSPAEAHLAEQPAVDPRVYDAVLKGHFHRQRFTPGDFTIALEYFEQALAIDSLYAPAHIGVAWVWGSRAQIGLVPPSEARLLSETHIEKALQLDPQRARAHFLQAGLDVWGDWDLEAGEAAFRRALELDPNDAEIHVLYGHVLAMLGRWDEAREHGKRALRLDRLNPFVQGLHGSLLVFVGQSDDAIVVLQDMMARNPGVAFGVDMLGDALHAAGREAEALRVYRDVYRAYGHQDVAAALNRGLETGAYAGAWKEAADVIAARPRSGPGVGPWMVANLYGFAGEDEAAIAWLEIAIERRNQNVPYIGIMPAFARLHDHPRFQKLAQDIGVPVISTDRS